MTGNVQTWVGVPDSYRMLHMGLVTHLLLAHAPARVRS